MAFCSVCGTQIADGGTVCAACAGRGAQPAMANSGLADNVAGMLAYITFIPAIIFLVTAPYNQSRFVRFHAFQCLFMYVAAIACWVGLAILSMVLAFIPILGHILAFLLWMALSVGFFVA